MLCLKPYFYLWIFYTFLVNIMCVEKMEAKIVFWAMKKISYYRHINCFFQETSLFHRLCTKQLRSRTFFDLSSPRWQETGHGNGAIMQKTVNYSVIIHVDLHHCFGSSNNSSTLPYSSPINWDCEAVGECGAHREGGRRFAGLSGREKQDSREGASAEQGSSFVIKKKKERKGTKLLFHILFS